MLAKLLQNSVLLVLGVIVMGLVLTAIVTTWNKAKLMIKNQQRPPVYGRWYDHL